MNGLNFWTMLPARVRKSQQSPPRLRSRIQGLESGHWWSSAPGVCSWICYAWTGKDTSIKLTTGFAPPILSFVMTIRKTLTGDTVVSSNICHMYDDCMSLSWHSRSCWWWVIGQKIDIRHWRLLRHCSHKACTPWLYCFRLHNSVCRIVTPTSFWYKQRKISSQKTGIYINILCFM